MRGEAVGEQVAAFRRRFPTMKFCFTGDDFAAVQQKLLRTF